MESRTVEEETIYGQLIEHLADRYGPEDAVNRATDILAKFYLSVEQ